MEEKMKMKPGDVIRNRHTNKLEVITKVEYVLHKKERILVYTVGEGDLFSEESLLENWILATNRVWTCKGFKGRWPVGTAAVVVAETAERAAELLMQECFRIELHQDEPITADKMEEVNVSYEHSEILLDGEY